MKIREAMSRHQQRELLTGIVEIDEAYIGGKPRKSCPSDKHKKGRGTDKTPVAGMVELNGKVKAKVVKKTDLNAKKLSSLWPAFKRLFARAFPGPGDRQLEMEDQFRDGAIDI